MQCRSVASSASSCSCGGNNRYTSPSVTLTGNTFTESSSPERHSPDSSENVFLCNGQATLGVSPCVPTMPRERTKARLCGHMFWQAYHSPRLEKLKTAICALPYL